MKFATLAISSTLIASASASGVGANFQSRIIKSIVENDLHEGRRQLKASSKVGGAPLILKKSEKAEKGLRFLEENQQDQCDSAFLGCLPNPRCLDCFATLELEAIDWTGVTPDTACPDVVDVLIEGKHCTKLKGDQEAIATFCNTFNACVVWDDDDDYADDDAFEPSEDEDWVNCTALTSCDWPGMKRSWLGDGVCNDNMHGCYNTKLCGFDGGDCCKDTCDDGEAEFKECGQDGWACRDPESAECNPSLTAKCMSSNTDSTNVKCGSDEQKYRLVMYDSFGDGWDTTVLTMTPKGAKRPAFTGSLKDGAQGTEYVCLSKDPTCYNVVTSGGTWGVEVSWELKTMAEGSIAIAGGGAPQDCNFPIAGSDCEKTCEGKANTDPTKDPDYKSFKELYECISDKCMIQLNACEKDEVCEKCFEQEAPEYCYGVDTFNAVIDCTMCSCTEKKGSEYCEQKGGPGGNKNPNKDGAKDDDNSAPKRCTGEQTMKGSKAVMAYAQCANLDETGVMITEFDQNNFGQLDQFEACSHSFANDPSHGGHTALGCMRILYNAMTNPISPENTKDPPLDAIAALARDLYDNAEDFCDCSKKASDDCPQCPAFQSFKTLLYESLDACVALDEIDCDAWTEFWRPCKDNMEADFGSSDFKKKEQCTYAKAGCGNAGPFPAFRKLDCEKEIDGDAWDFYKTFSKNCLKGSDGVPPDGPRPVPTPTKSPDKPKAPTDPPAPTDGGSTPTMKPYTPDDAKPYVPSGEKGSSSEKKKGHFFRNLMILGALGGIGYYLYKQRSDSFNFVQYRRLGRPFGNGFGNAISNALGNVFGRRGGVGAGAGPYGGNSFGGASDFSYDMGDSHTLYSNLNSSTSFEPPSLPPTPTQMMGTEMT